MVIKFTAKKPEDEEGVEKPDPVLPGALVWPHHARIWADIDNFARMAGVTKNWIVNGADDHLTPDEIDWVKKFKQHENGGMLFVGQQEDTDPKLNAITGMLTRNFLHARVMTVQAFAMEVESGEVPNETCVLVSNLYLAKGTIPQWKVGLVMDGLQSRLLTGKRTVLAGSDMSMLKAEYGAQFHRWLEMNFDIKEV